MGIFYWVEAVALAEDVPEVESYTSLEDFYAQMTNGYQQVSWLVENTPNSPSNRLKTLLQHGNYPLCDFVYCRTPTIAG